MFSPFKVSDFHGKILSVYIGASNMNAGALVDIDTTDTIAVSSSVGFDALRAGTVKLATIAPHSNGGYAPSGAAANTIVAPNYGRELGMAIPTMNLTGPSLQERILELASSYMTVPQGSALAIFVPAPGDIVATTEFVGYLPGDTGATGLINQTTLGNYGQAVGIFNGRFRLVQPADEVRGRYLGNTTVNGSLVGLFQFR